MGLHRRSIPTAQRDSPIELWPNSFLNGICTADNTLVYLAKIRMEAEVLSKLVVRNCKHSYYCSKSLSFRDTICMLHRRVKEEKTRTLTMLYHPHPHYLHTYCMILQPIVCLRLFQNASQISSGIRDTFRWLPQQLQQLVIKSSSPFSTVINRFKYGTLNFHLEYPRFCLYWLGHVPVFCTIYVTIGKKTVCIHLTLEVSVVSSKES